MNQTDQNEDAFMFPERKVSTEASNKSRALLMRRLEDADRKRTSRSALIRMAGISVAACLAVVVGYYSLPSPKASVYAGIGEKLEKTLPDGSLVILNSDSRIRYNSDIIVRPKREVWIEGEAFFKVSRTSDVKPFIVHTDHFDVEVTGTQFNLSSGNDSSSILLTEGSVTLHMPDGRSVNMKPGAYFSAKDAISEIGNKNASELVMVHKPQAVLSWLNKNLVFEDSPLRDVAREIEVLYKVKIRFGSSTVAERRITGILPNENLDILLRALEATTDFSIVQENNIVNIQENP
jgi:transmembrane sensor